MLRYGEHIVKSNRGFGIIHIWERHNLELQKIGYTNIDEVARYVSDIIITGTPIYCEFEDIRGNHRATVIRGNLGAAILEQKTNNNMIFYSVVTAFTNAKPRGTQIARVA